MSTMVATGMTEDYLNGWQNRNFTVYGRLRPGVSFKQATANRASLART